jgi:N6-adenosine-specific RNA methylase IME4
MGTRGRPRLYADLQTKWRENKRRQRHPDLRHVPASQAPGVFTLDLDTLVTSGQQFRTIYADPPWSYKDQPPKGGAAKKYPVMALDAICALPIRALAVPQAHLHLWTTKDFRFEAKGVLDAWGFTFKSEVVWIKTTDDGRKERFGSGHYYRMAHEVLFVGIRGGLQPLRRNLPSVLFAPRGVHSEKPEQMRDLVEQFSPGPYLELFGRAAVPGWTVWGNECHPANGRLFKEGF